MKTFDYSLVKDPQYFKDGRMDAHSDHTYYRDGEEALEKETSFRYDLNGIWKFHYARNYGNAIPGFEKTDYCCKDWDDIRVPAHIQMEGYDAPQYANVQYPWEGHEDIHPGEIPEKRKKSWSSHQLLAVHLNTCAASLFSPSFTYSVSSNSDGVKESSLYPTNCPLSHNAMPLSAPWKEIKRRFPCISSGTSKYFT